MMIDDGDLERTFAALPPAPGRGFARTWWGLAWLKALEDSALDSRQLKAGRKHARAGAVGAVSVRPGRITAVVRDGDGDTHRADVLLAELSGSQWDRFLAMSAERAGHVAALLDHDMPPHLVEDAESAGVGLLPGMGDLEPRCDCGAWDHCAHTAALCYQMARLLDEDPFALLLMRGRGERALLEGLRTLGATGGPVETGATGVDAVEIYATAAVLPPLPPPPERPSAPGSPPYFETGTPPAPGVDPARVRELASLTAFEADRLLAEALRGYEGSAPREELTVARDAVRLAAGVSDPALLERLAEGSGLGRQGLADGVLAWRQGGADALDVWDGTWTVPGASMARARAALEAAWEPDERPSLRAEANRWTVVGGGAQLRLGRDGRWWPYRNEQGRWVPAGGPARDPATALNACAAPDGEEA
ncbi:SWF or SNF family helicase [Streptomyces sp. NPDC005840]|uniref:SWF or SNF family helicase n=1 Tax=Streptomyces sp. NPDC005840 TaxID=3157072 RepID=UPI0033E51596